jgi:hypothetical protein
MDLLGDRLLAYRVRVRSLIDRIVVRLSGGFRPGYDGRAPLPSRVAPRTSLSGLEGIGMEASSKGAAAAAAGARHVERLEREHAGYRRIAAALERLR